MTWLWGYFDPPVYYPTGIISQNQSGLLALQRNCDISPAMPCVIVTTSVQKNWIKLEQL